jgi:CheY-like chemotaxis protein/tetratricopeptide (TPR) repeat protein
MGYKVLIAEDDRHTRTILEHIFTKDPAFKDQDIELLLASDGEQALRYFKSHDPDLIISDLLMPKVDGFAFCRTVRNTPKGKDLPLVITSAIYKETALLNRLREELNVTFFPKPFQVREFTKEISRMMNLENSESVEPEEKEFVERVTMSKPFKGKLPERSLPSLLLDIQNIDGTGVLKIERGKIKKEIFFLFGRPVGAESNIRHENLGNYLVSKNIISKEQHHQLLSSARENHISFLKALMELKKFDESLVLKYHSSLVKVRIVNAFKWHKGEYSFLPGDSFSDRIIKAPVDPIALVFAGLKRITDLDTITDKLQDDITSVITITKRGEKHKDEFQRIFGAKIFDEIEDNKTSLGELLGKGIDPMTLYTHVFVMAETGMIEFEKQENAKDESLNLSMLEDPLNLSNLKKAAAPSNSPEEEISIVANVPTPESQEESGLILDLPIEVENEEDKKLINELKKFYLDIHEKDFFEILGVEKNATQKEIDSAFAVLQSQFSYDMFEDVDLGSDHAKLEEISEFLKIAKETLSDPVKRKRYEEQNLKQKKKGASFVEAEVYAKKAEQALNTGSKSVALNNIDKAIEVEPDIGDYHAIKAKILQSKGTPAQKVISTLENALELDPESVIINFTGAEIFKSMGKMDRAINLYQKVLENRPEHKESFA